jgi:PKD repeat protein
VEDQKIIPSDIPRPNRSYFGLNLSISGDVALVGAHGDINGTGAVYVYRYNGSSWVEEQKLTASDGYWNHGFGWPVSIGGNVALIGAVGATSAGAAYVYRYNGSTWLEEQKIIPSDGAAGDLFGESASIDGDIALIGAWGDDSYTGSAYVYRYNGSSWVEDQKLYAYDGVAYDFFGRSVSMNGDVALVGAHQEITGTGAAYVYRYDSSSSSWVEDQKLTASDGTAEDLFGYAVSCSGNVALIGAHGDNESGIRSGSAYVFSFPNTPSGDDVSVAITDTMTGAEVVLTFGEVTTAGNTTVTTSSSGPELPSTFGLGQPPTYFNITTNADYAPPVTITIDYSGITFSKDESELRLLQETDAGWLDITTSVDTINKIIYGETTGLSFFAVVEPTNEPPIADPGYPYTGEEGSPVTFDGTSSYDPDGDSLIYEWTFGDNNFGSGPTPSHTYADNGTYNVCLTVTDSEETDMQCTTADIDNVDPLVEPITAPVDPLQVGTDVNAEASFTDPGTLDTHTANCDWGDLTPVDIMDPATSPTSASHIYDTPGVYTIELAVTDDDGGVGTSMFQYVVVYDPTGGFVTGGGWIDSPAGAYAADPSLTGKATFGFVSKYKKGATTPTGQTEFQFRVADLNFHSDTYQWLVIAGARAQYKGTGTINGEGNFGFMLTAIDGALLGGGGSDKFRMKIWDMDDAGAIVYDNQMGAAEGADSATQIGGGSIVIHNKSK